MWLTHNEDNCTSVGRLWWGILWFINKKILDRNESSGVVDSSPFDHDLYGYGSLNYQNVWSSGINAVKIQKSLLLSKSKSWCHGVNWNFTSYTLWAKNCVHLKKHQNTVNHRELVFQRLKFQKGDTSFCEILHMEHEKILPTKNERLHIESILLQKS